MRITIAFVAIAFFGLASLPLAAQASFNPKVGFNISALDTRLQDIHAEARAGWNIGFDLHLGPGNVYFNPGFHYYSMTARLVKDVDSPDDVELSDETTIQSLRVPLNLGIRVAPGSSPVNLRFQGGLVPAYVMSVKERPSFNLDVDDLNRLTLGADVGVGLDLLFLTFDVNYEIGLSRFFEDASGKNNMLTGSIGVKF